MSSNARKAFDQNAGDIQRLLDLHRDVGGEAKGRRYGLEVLNKSAVVLITAFWEAYCEDIASEGLHHIIKHAKSAEALPIELKKVLAKELKSANNELEVWTIADNGWRVFLLDRFDKLKESRDRKLNTPKSHQIDELFRSTLGIPTISSSWIWAKKMTADRARKKLDKYVTLRGSIAHRGKHDESVTKANVTDYFEFIKTVVSRTGGKVNGHVRLVTGKPLWRN